MTAINLKWFVREYVEFVYNGIDVRKAWPVDADKKEFSKQEEWAKGFPWASGSKKYSVIDTDNFIQKNHLDLMRVSDSRGQGSRVPQALVYLSELDCYAQIDYRADCLIDMIIDYGFNGTNPKDDLCIIFNYGNYYLTPYSSNKAKEYFAPKVKKEEHKVDLIEGDHYELAYSKDPVTYLGRFAIIDNRKYPQCDERKVHAFEEKFMMRRMVDGQMVVDQTYFNLCCFYNKPKVKKAKQTPISEEVWEGNALIIGQYPLTAMEEWDVDMTNRTITITDKKNRTFCGW